MQMPDEKKRGSSGCIWMLFLCHGKGRGVGWNAIYKYRKNVKKIVEEKRESDTLNGGLTTYFSGGNKKELLLVEKLVGFFFYYKINNSEQELLFHSIRGPPFLSGTEHKQN